MDRQCHSVGWCVGEEELGSSLHDRLLVIALPRILIRSFHDSRLLASDDFSHPPSRTNLVLLLEVVNERFLRVGVTDDR